MMHTLGLLGVLALTGRRCCGALAGSVTAGGSCQPACTSGRGLCIEGKCFCRSPWGGADCSLNAVLAVTPPPPPAISRRRSGRPLALMEEAGNVQLQGGSFVSDPAASGLEVAPVPFPGLAQVDWPPSGATATVPPGALPRSSSGGPYGSIVPVVGLLEKHTSGKAGRKTQHRSDSGATAGQLIRELFQENTRLRQEDAHLKTELAGVVSERANRWEFAFGKSPTFLAAIGLTCLTLLFCLGCACGLFADSFSRILVLSLAVVNCMMLKLLWWSGTFKNLVNEFVMYASITVSLLSIVVFLLLYMYHKRKQALVALLSENDRVKDIWNKVVIDVGKTNAAKRNVYGETSKLGVGEC